MRLKLGEKTLTIGARTLIMGIMNLTPDSFSGDGRLRLQGGASAHARFVMNMVRDGADMIDVGAESSRPGARQVSAAEEIRRLLPVLRLLARECPVPISVDTYKPDVVRAALDNGATIVNTILGLRRDKRLLAMVRDYGAAIVVMHARGPFSAMHRRTRYKDLMAEIVAELRGAVDFCLETGIQKDRIIVDPGIGFSKTAEQNLSILNGLHMLKAIRRPLLVGASRKSFIGKVLDAGPQDRGWGTAAVHALAIARGAHILRAHDVPAAKNVARMTDAIVSA